jgi:hypothetical protein
MTDATSALRTRHGGRSITGVAAKKPPTISYPAPDARARRHDQNPLDPRMPPRERTHQLMQYDGFYR